MGGLREDGDTTPERVAARREGRWQELRQQPARGIILLTNA